MIGELISRIRNEKNVTKTELARRTNINIGHLVHIEKEERNPSSRAIKTICRALEVPYQPLMYADEKILTEEQEEIYMINHISYEKILAVGSLDSFIKCPLDLPSANMAVKINDKSMEPRLEEGTYAFIEFNTPLDNKDIGIFEYDDKVIIRRFVIRKESLVLRADNKDFSDILLPFDGDYNIIGKVIGTSTGLIF